MIHGVAPPPLQAAREAAEAQARAKAEAKAAERAVREAEKEVEAKKRAAEKAAAKEAARAEKEAARAAAKAAKDEGKEEKEKAKAARAEAAAAKAAAKAAKQQQRKRSGALGRWSDGLGRMLGCNTGCRFGCKGPMRAQLESHSLKISRPTTSPDCTLHHCPSQPPRARSRLPSGLPPAAAKGCSVGLPRCPRLKRRPRRWERRLWLRRRTLLACRWAGGAAVQTWRPCRPTWQLRMAAGSQGLAAAAM